MQFFKAIFRQHFSNVQVRLLGAALTFHGWRSNFGALVISDEVILPPIAPR
jgi:hypothetical protein